jgi:hypothetical protein
MSHRIVVMCEGRITGELSIDEATQENIMKYATQRRNGDNGRNEIIGSDSELRGD